MDGEVLLALVRAADCRLAELAARKGMETGVTQKDADEAYSALTALASHGDWRWRELQSGFDELAEFTVMLCVLQAAQPERFSVLFDAVDAGGVVTMEAAARLLYEDMAFFPAQLRYEEFKEAFAPIKQVLCVENDKDEPEYRRQLTADERFMAYLQGNDDIDAELGDFAQLCFPYSPQAMCTGIDEYDKALGEIKQNLFSPFGEHFIQLSGAQGSGRRFLLKQAFYDAGKELLLIDYSRLRKAAQNAAEFDRLMAKLRREQAFYGAGVCLWGLSEASCPDDNALKEVFDYVLSPFVAAGALTAACVTPKMTFIGFCRRYVPRVELPQASRGARIRLWEFFRDAYELPKGCIDCVKVGSKYTLSPGDISRLAEHVAMSVAQGAVIDDKLIADACYELIPAFSTGTLIPIRTGFTMDDLVISLAQRETLESLCAHVTYRHLVYDVWDMQAKYPYGKNVSALFVGPPGTGKTMAAHVVSAQLGIPLYRIDLSQVVDKYIGETEKKLEKIFDMAQRSNTILFFDEADAIFGKRTELNDSKDRYANTEVAYILQRIEEYDGLVLMASNLRANIDEAFLRRIRFLVEFNMPGPELRKALWMGAFAKGVPTGDLDFDFLADKFELAGGAIKNIVLNAAFMAAADRSPVTMLHVLKSLREENHKMGKNMLLRDFGEYGVYF